MTLELATTSVTLLALELTLSVDGLGWEWFASSDSSESLGEVMVTGVGIDVFGVFWVEVEVEVVLEVVLEAALEIALEEAEAGTGVLNSAESSSPTTSLKPEDEPNGTPFAVSVLPLRSGVPGTIVLCDKCE